MKTVKGDAIAYEVREITTSAAKSTKKSNPDGSFERILKAFEKKEEAEQYKEILDKKLGERSKAEKTESGQDAKPAAGQKS